MSTTSRDLERGPRSSLGLLDLPREIRDRIYGYLFCDKYLILPGYLQQGSPMLPDDDSRHLSILRVSKCVNREVMQVLQMESWFICNLGPCDYHRSIIQEAPTQHMMNVELVIGRNCSGRDMPTIIDLNLAGTETLRRTCHILIPALRPTLANDYIKDYEALRLYFKYIKLLTGFATVVVQVDLSRKTNPRGVKYNDERAQILGDMIEFSEPALGPAVPCDSVRERYDVNFRFFPRRFVAERLASAELGVGNEEHKRDQ